MSFSRRLQQASRLSGLDLWDGPHSLDGYVALHPELQPLANQPIAQWLGDWEQTPQSVMGGYVSAAGGKTIVVAIYAIPGRDAGGYSSGGFPSQAAYLNWVTQVRNGAGTGNVWYVLEPDALGHANMFSPSVKAERLDTLSQAVTILKSSPNARVYIDCSHWVSASDTADLLVASNIAACEGFSLNVSNFQTTDSMYTYGDAVVAQLVSRGVTGKQYVIDTARNGNGPLTPAFGSAGTPWLNAGKDWCNPPGRAIGLSPRVPDGRPNCAALLYIKIIGESDGNDPGSTFFSDYYGENAPPAGTFWLKWLQDAMAHTDQSNFS